MFRFPLLVLDLQQGLFAVVDSDAILITVVVDDAGGGVVQHDLSGLPKVDVLNPVVAGLAPVGHYDLVDEFLLGCNIDLVVDSGCFDYYFLDCFSMFSCG